MKETIEITTDTEFYTKPSLSAIGVVYNYNYSNIVEVVHIFVTPDFETSKGSNHTVGFWRIKKLK